MKVKGKIKFDVNLGKLTKHISDRKSRMDKYLEVKDIGSVYECFLVDKEHINGDEVHVITTNGFIMIFNSISKRFITILHARPMQLYRYYNMIGEDVPLVVKQIGKSNGDLNNKLNLNGI